MAVYSGDDPKAVELILMGRAGQIFSNGQRRSKAMHELCAAALKRVDTARKESMIA